jgi:hypothetical protein
MKPVRPLILGGVCLACVLLLSYLFSFDSAARRREEQSLRPPALPATPPEPLGALDPARAALRPVEPDPSLPVAPHSRSLRGPGGSPTEEANTVLVLLDLYRERFGGYPAGAENADFVRALLGANPERLAFLPPDHPAVNSAGQLTDPFGTPYFFHLISRDLIEVRGAGPDRQLHTEDDSLAGGVVPVGAAR